MRTWAAAGSETRHAAAQASDFERSTGGPIITGQPHPTAPVKRFRFSPVCHPGRFVIARRAIGASVSRRNSNQKENIMPKNNKTAARKPAGKKIEKLQSPSAQALPAAVIPNDRLVEVGSRYFVDRLANFATETLTRMASYPFGDAGFDAAWRTAFKGTLADLKSAVAELETEREDALPSGLDAEDALVQAKEWRRRASAAVRSSPVLADKAPDVHTGSSIPRLVASIQ